MSWATLEAQAPGLAALGKARLNDKVAILGTTRKDGSQSLENR